MSITLEMRPTDPPMGWDEFRAKTPKFSIALDGFVSTGPRFDGSGPWLNLNHHEDVDRLATRATCGQVLMALRQGLFTCFRDASGPRATVWVNDCDEDASRLTKLLAGMRAKINLIPLNPHPELEMSPPSAERVIRFQEILIARHFTAIVRKSKGRDISAACGQLSGEFQGGEG